MPIRILIVEDDEDDYLLTRKLLRDNTDTTFEVTWARTFDAAIDELRKPYDVVLVDYRLGSHNGLDLIETAVAVGIAAPIILLTGRGDPSVDKKAMKLGASDYLVKDQITPQLMERVIRHSIERKGSELELKALVDHLEERVQDRTAEVVKTLQESESLLREKTSLLQEVHHRVKNNLQMISSLLNLQARAIKDSDTRALFRETQGRVRSIALLHESLYQSADLGRVDMRGYVDKLVGTLTRTYRQSARIVVEIDQIQLPADLAVPCGLIVNELITNALKHAFPDSRDIENNDIRVEMRRVADEFSLVVADNGSGFADAVNPIRAETMGLTLVRDLSAQLRGHAEFSMENGARCSVRFPVPTKGAGA